MCLSRIWFTRVSNVQYMCDMCQKIQYDALVSPREHACPASRRSIMWRDDRNFGKLCQFLVFRQTSKNVCHRVWITFCSSQRSWALQEIQILACPGPRRSYAKFKHKYTSAPTHPHSALRSALFCANASPLAALVVLCDLLDVLCRGHRKHTLYCSSQVFLHSCCLFSYYKHWAS